MKIWIDTEYRIRDIDENADASFTIIELDELAPSFPFSGWSENRILSYCYKSLDGAVSLYPFVDIEVINKFDEYATQLEARATAGETALTQLIREDALTEEQTLRLVDIYPPYQVDKEYKVGAIFKNNGLLYEVIQEHTSQLDWLPSTTLALYKNRTPSLLIGEWVQPTGGHDAYDKGDKVIYKGVVWTSKIDGNATIPDGDEPYNRYWSRA